MGAGHVSPIWRGGGVNQKLLLDYARRVAAGNWCHVFPEGGIWQRKELGGRQNDRVREIGKLKWGIGKLIAHSPQRPIVIPFFFMGTETITPLHPVTKKLEKSIPNIGHKVHLQFGKSIEFDDLIKEHEAQYGPLWKYSASVEIDKQRGYNSEDYHSYWDSRPEDYHLYSKITRRIEKALEEMNENFEAKAVDK